ncbi:MAG: hypothetical protein K6B73_05955 [Treponema sp.]|nr:hypothetical protein [Treponema sp.]
MGLLSRINNLENQPEQSPQVKKEGLLAKASRYDTKSVTFAELAKQNNFYRCALFTNTEDFYHVKKSFNFDLESIADSVSSKDFWDGLDLTEGEWKAFSEESLTPLYQLFSEQIKNEIVLINILKFTLDNKSAYLVVINHDGELEDASVVSQAVIQSLDAKQQPSYDSSDGFVISSAYLFIISAKLSLENAFNKYDSSISDKLTDAAMEEIFYKISELLFKPNVPVLKSNCEIKAIMFSREDIDEKLLQFHINSNLQEFFNLDEKGVLVLSAGVCPNSKGSISFLEQD